MSPTWATDLIPPWAIALWADEQSRLALPLVGAAVLAFLILPGRTKQDRTPSRREAEEDISRPRNTSWLRRLWWRIRRPTDLMAVDGLVIDRSRKPHCLWLGPTGAGKSASVATVRVNGERPMLLVMPDLSDPLRDAVLRLDGVIWTACAAGKPINFLLGEPTEVAERLTEVFRSGGLGAWKRAARQATAQVIRTIDASRQPRTLQLIGELLREMVASDRELKVVCAGWVSRFLDLADQFGLSIGPEGQDIAELLRAGRTVLLDNDAFDHPSLGGDVVALGLTEAKRCASLVLGGFRLVFEEAGQLGERVDLAEPFFRAGRRRKIMVDALTQAESDLNEGISANSGTRVYFAQELKSLQKVAADRLGFDYRELDPARMADFTAWVAHGKIRRLIRFPKPANAPVSRRETVSGSEGRRGSGDAGGRWRAPVPIERSRPVLPMLPPPGAVWQKYLDGTYREGGCLRWRGKHDRKGYGYIYLEAEEKSQLVHRWRAEQAYGPIGRDPVTGKKLTVDHRRTCFKDCSELTHLEVGVTRGENSSRRWRVRGVGAAAAD